MAETPKITTETGQIGYDLNSIIRDILQRVRRDRGWSEARLGRELGIPQSTMNRLLSPGGKFDLERLSEICAALEMNPVAFFASHPVYDHEARAFMRFGKDALYDRFRTLLTAEEARRVVHNIEVQKDLGVFDICTKTLDGIIEVAKTAQRKTIRDLRKPSASAR